jgi:hypothetical protein
MTFTPTVKVQRRHLGTTHSPTFANVDPKDQIKDSPELGETDLKDDSCGEGLGEGVHRVEGSQ